jgi:hypothetical protein
MECQKANGMPKGKWGAKRQMGRQKACGVLQRHVGHQKGMWGAQKAYGAPKRHDRIFCPCQIAGDEWKQREWRLQIITRGCYHPREYCMNATVHMNGVHREIELGSPTRKHMGFHDQRIPLPWHLIYHWTRSEWWCKTQSSEVSNGEASVGVIKWASRSK